MKKLFVFCTLILLCSFKHPFYLSVTDLKYNTKDKAIQGSVKLFVNDAEGALKKSSGKAVDLINAKDREGTHRILSDYLKKNLVLKLNKETKTFEVLGYEIEEEAVWVYIEYKKCVLPKSVEIENSLLYDHIKSQTNIVHFELNGKTKSLKVSNPEKRISFNF